MAYGRNILNNVRLSKGQTREFLVRGMISTIGLLVRTSLDQLLILLKILFAFLTKQAILIWRSTVLSLPLQLAFLGQTLE
jgi:hypothetical protein